MNRRKELDRIWEAIEQLQVELDKRKNKENKKY